MSEADGATELRSYCRICSGVCGVRVRLDEDGRLLEVRGDREHPMTLGFACSKGLHAPATHNSPARLLHPLKRAADGSFVPVPLEQALDEIAAKLASLLERDGPDAIAAFRGTANYSNTVAFSMMQAWWRALGSSSFFSTMTIDQSAKWVTGDRMGRWYAGRHPFETSEVCLIFGANPLVSIQSGLGINVLNPVKRLREARARGLKLIVVDPRETELARHADIHLQCFPGEDVAIAAGMLHLILASGWEDREFCERWAADLDGLREAVSVYTPDYVASRAGVDEKLLRAAAELFALKCRRGPASSGTGPDMGPHSNLAEHMIEALNVVCGRYVRAGELVQNPGVLGKPGTVHAEVRPPRRRWEQGPRSRVRGLGMLMGEKMSGALADEILEPGQGRIRSLFVVGGNPVSALPEQRKAVEAMRALELLVVIEPFMTTTARLAHYVLPPKLQFERPDATLFAETFGNYHIPFAQYTPALAKPPSEELVDEWYVFWALGKRLGRPARLRGRTLDSDEPPSTEELLDLLTSDARIPLSEVRKHPCGKVYELPLEFVQPARQDATDRFALCPQDVRQELAEVREERYEHGRYEGANGPFTHLLAVRRLREVMNSAFHDLPEARRHNPYNTAAVNPLDLEEQGFRDGERVMLVGEHGRIPAVVTADRHQRRGVVSMSHGWGALPDDDADYSEVGACTSLLVSSEKDIEPINAMARMTALPVRFERCRALGRGERVLQEC